MRYLYLAPWEWQRDADVSYWRAPNGNALGCFDLRSLPQQALAGGTPQGYGLFVYDYDPAIRGGLMLATGLDSTLQAAKTRLQNALGVTLDANTPRALLWELLTTRADPTGESRWKPLRGSLRRPTRMGLDDSLRVSMGPEILAATVVVFQADYRRNRAEGMVLESLRKWTGSTMVKLFGRMSDSLSAQVLPLEYVSDGWQPPSTTIGDTFVEATGNPDLDTHTATGPNGGFSWTHVYNGGSGAILVISADDAITANATAHRYRAESALSSDDMSSECDVNVIAVSVASVGARFAAAADTCYYLTLKNNATDTWRLFKVVAGTKTQVGSSVNETPPTPVFNMRLNVNGSSLEGFLNDGSKITGTDTAITGNTRAGVELQNAATNWRLDNFEAADLAAAATPGGSVVPLMGGMGLI